MIQSVSRLQSHTAHFSTQSVDVMTYVVTAGINGSISANCQLLLELGLYGSYYRAILTQIGRAHV